MKTRTKYTVPDITRQQAMNLYLSASNSSISYTNRVAWCASATYKTLDVEERGEITFSSQEEYNRAISLVEDKVEINSNRPNKKNLLNMWCDLANRIENDVVKN